jgi:multidrug efflux pump subunit AcrA (membrane-fusion protein)
MKTIPALIGFGLLIVLCSGVWVMRYRPQWLEPAEAAGAADEEVDPQKLEIPVHKTKIVKTTLRRYVEAFGAVEPAPARPGRMAGTADVAVASAGVVAEVLCQAGASVKQGAALIQLDDRVAKAAEQQAAAAVEEAKASMAQLKATPRPEQLELAQLAVDRARASVEFAKKNQSRQQDLAKGGGVSAKALEQASLDLGSAQSDLASAEKQLALLKASPTPEELAAQSAKVAEAEAALVAARTQREILRITSPIDGTIVAVHANPGDSVDSSKLLVDIVALDRLVVNIAVPIDELPSLTVGMTAQIQSPPATDSEGKIFLLGSEVDRKTNTIPVGIDIAPEAGLKPGQTVHVRMVVEEHKDRLAVPKECVVADENGDTFIATVVGDQATHKTVKVGLREKDLVEIDADGLKEGDDVVSSGAYGLAKFQVARVKVLEN